MKTEPSEYSIDDLVSDKVTTWTGIRNYQVRNMLRDQVGVGDTVLIYHSSTKIPGIVGEAKVTKTAHPDPTQFDPTNEYYDMKSLPEQPRWLSVELTIVKKWKTIVTLEQIRVIPDFADSPLIRRGNRLSVIPLTKVQYQIMIPG